NYYLIYSELGLHYNKRVNEDAAKAYLKVINSEKGFFIPVQNALRSALTVELNSFIVSEDAESLRSAIRLSTLEAICEALGCQPGEILEYRSNDKQGNGLN